MKTTMVYKNAIRYSVVHNSIYEKRTRCSLALLALCSISMPSTLWVQAKPLYLTLSELRSAAVFLKVSLIPVCTKVFIQQKRLGIP